MVLIDECHHIASNQGQALMQHIRAKYVYGLTAPTPYSRLNVPYSYRKNPDSMYLDELGEFNKTRTFVLNLLFKNGLYCLSGEVAHRGD